MGILSAPQALQRLLQKRSLSLRLLLGLPCSLCVSGQPRRTAPRFFGVGFVRGPRLRQVASRETGVSWHLVHSASFTNYRLTWAVCLQLWPHCLRVRWASSRSCLRRLVSAQGPEGSSVGGVPGEPWPDGKCSQILELIPFSPIWEGTKYEPKKIFLF